MPIRAITTAQWVVLGASITSLNLLATFDAAQDAVGFLGGRCALLAGTKLFIHQNPPVLLHRATVNEIISQSVMMSWIALI